MRHDEKGAMTDAETKDEKGSATSDETRAEVVSELLTESVREDEDGVRRVDATMNATTMREAPEQRWGWVGFDLDGTLAKYGGWDGRIGAPIPAMVAKVKELRARGWAVKIVTARVARRPNDAEVEAERILVGDWCEEHLGERLTVTAGKDFGMIALYDDRAVAVESNTGRVLGGVEP